MKGGAVIYKGIPIRISAPDIKCKICGDKAEDADQQQFTIRESGNVIATCEDCYNSIMFDEED
jgi:ribosome-binding protein aMBF1 (putative translation factor)